MSASYFLLSLVHTLVMSPVALNLLSPPISAMSSTWTQIVYLLLELMDSTDVFAGDDSR